MELFSPGNNTTLSMRIMILGPRTLAIVSLNEAKEGVALAMLKAGQKVSTLQMG